MADWYNLPEDTPPGPLGLILPEQMNQKQRDAHEAALAKMPRFALAPVDLPKGTKIILTDCFKSPDVIADIGAQFTGYGQYTGSCVGVSDGNAGATVLGVQRLIADNPRKAGLPWWAFNYGRTRYLEGDRGQGEGAVDSVAGQQLVTEGLFEITEAGLPAFSKTGPDGWWLSSQIEMTWSDGSRIAQNWITLAAKRAGTTKAVIGDSGGVRSALSNGYAVLDGCNNYVGTGSIVQDADGSYTGGHYTSRGGHSTTFVGVWHHPNKGYLYLYWNQWPTSTYPKDPAGGVRCSVWLPESEVDKLFQTGGSGGETMALSNTPAFPVQIDKILSWIP